MRSLSCSLRAQPRLPKDQISSVQAGGGRTGSYSTTDRSTRTDAAELGKRKPPQAREAEEGIGAAARGPPQQPDGLQCRLFPWTQAQLTRATNETEDLIPGGRKTQSTEKTGVRTWVRPKHRIGAKLFRVGGCVVACGRVPRSPGTHGEVFRGKQGCPPELRVYRKRSATSSTAAASHRWLLST